MNLEDFRDYCLNKPGTTEEVPFGPDTLVFKVGGKMFAACGMEDFERVNLKCNPEKALELREQHEAIQPGWHMNKRHWNSVYVAELGDDPLFLSLVDHSYALVFDSLPRTVKSAIDNA